MWCGWGLRLLRGCAGCVCMGAVVFVVFSDRGVWLLIAVVVVVVDMSRHMGRVVGLGVDVEGVDGCGGLYSLHGCSCGACELCCGRLESCDKWWGM